MLTITVNSAPVTDILAQLSARLSDLTPAMEGIGQALQGRVSARFETQSDPMGTPWDAWAPATFLSYPKDGNRRILDRYGDMLDSLTHAADATSATIGFGNPVATYHEWGTKHMPRRGILTADPETGTLAPDDEQHVIDILSTFLAV